MPTPLLLLSYGAPERREDVLPFLHNLFADKNVPAQRIATAAQKYERFAAQAGHYSPLNSECRNLIDGIRQIAPDLPVYWGNLFWHPLLADTVAEMKRDGVERAVCFATSAFDSPPGNQRYADALAKAVETNPPVKIEKLPLPFDHPLFIEAQAERLLEVLEAGSTAMRNDQMVRLSDPVTPALTCTPGNPSYILFSAHSIPLADATRSSYVRQLQSTCRVVIDKINTSIPWELVYQSRSGTAEHWLGPDIQERINELAATGVVESVLVSPIGFFCENMETEYDLDVEVRKRCEELGLTFRRAKATGTLPQICRLTAELAGAVK